MKKQQWVFSFWTYSLLVCSSEKYLYVDRSYISIFSLDLFPKPRPYPAAPLEGQTAQTEVMLKQTGCLPPRLVPASVNTTPTFSYSDKNHQPSKQTKSLVSSFTLSLTLHWICQQVLFSLPHTKVCHLSVPHQRYFIGSHLWHFSRTEHHLLRGLLCPCSLLPQVLSVLNTMILLKPKADHVCHPCVQNLLWNKQRPTKSEKQRPLIQSLLHQGVSHHPLHVGSDSKAAEHWKSSSEIRGGCRSSLVGWGSGEKG